MANVFVVQVGSTSTKSVSASTVKEAIAAYDSSMDGNYKVKVNNEESTMDTPLSEGDFISIGDKVKGGAARQ